MSDTNADYNLILGDSAEILPSLEECSVDAIVTDPPYGISMRGHKWDYDVPSVEIWAECLRVLKPGGHLLSFAGARTHHRMAINIEDAGFEIRDMIAWIYGEGMPHGMNVSKSIDRMLGAEREVVGRAKGAGSNKTEALGDLAPEYDATLHSSDEAKMWEGWHTALRPSLEPITLARKPLDGTVAENVMRWGVGALNVLGCGIVNGDKVSTSGRNDSLHKQSSALGSGWSGDVDTSEREWRFPANVLHDGQDFIPQKYFYIPKASYKDRHAGVTRNHHVSVKPTGLMAYLCRLVTPPGGLVLDPFMGSGSTGRGAILEGFRFTGIELDSGYLEIARGRIDHARNSRLNKTGDFRLTDEEASAGQASLFGWDS